tara:strand:- start:2 stop:376 length:375 start_codon:yes stop_codon:yes gene_type:complete
VEEVLEVGLIMLQVVMGELLLHQVYNPAQEEEGAVLMVLLEEYNLLSMVEMEALEEDLEVVTEILLVEVLGFLVKVMMAVEQTLVMLEGVAEKVLLVLFQMEEQVKHQVLLDRLLHMLEEAEEE